MKQKPGFEEIIDSLNGVNRAAMPEALRESIIRTLVQSRKKIVALPRQTILLLAAGLALLIGFNVYSLVAHRKGEAQTVAAKANPLADEYFAPPPSI